MAKKIAYLVHTALLPLLLALISLFSTNLIESINRFFRPHYGYVIALLLAYVLLGIGMFVAAINLPKYKKYVSTRVVLSIVSLLLLSSCFGFYGTYSIFTTDFGSLIDFFVFTFLDLSLSGNSMRLIVAMFYSAMAIYSFTGKKKAISPPNELQKNGN